jgi:hypothetical protein
MTVDIGEVSKTRDQACFADPRHAAARRSRWKQHSPNVCTYIEASAGEV